MHQKGMALAAVAAALLAGCAGPGGPPAPERDSVTVVTDPSQGRQDPSAGVHLHDYWGSSDRKLVLAKTVPVGYVTLSTGQQHVAAALVPDPGDVVPQGTARVEVTMAWTPSPEMGAANTVAGARLAVRTAADSEARDQGPVENGVPLSMPSTNAQNDLPHQVLSGWEFQWVVDPLPLAGPLGVVTFQGELHVRVEAVRGLEIPLYPGHPDQWGGRGEMPLFDAEGFALMDGDMREGNVRCYGSCPERLRPASGAVVPVDAHHVRVAVEREAPSPTRFGLAYHTAVSREWQVATPVEETGTSRTYVIDVLDGGDGPYARQSNWEFVLFVEEPVEDGFLADTYRVAATVHRRP